MDRENKNAILQAAKKLKRSNKPENAEEKISGGKNIKGEGEKENLSSRIANAVEKIKKD